VAARWLHRPSACLSLLLLLVAFLAGCEGAEAALDQADAARIGRTVIGQAQYESRVTEFGKELRGQVPDRVNDPEGYRAFENKVLDYMVTLEIVRQKASKLDIAVTDQEVQAKLAEIARQSFDGDLSKLEQSLEATGTGLSTYRQELAEQMLIYKARTEVIRSVPAPTDKEIGAYYQANLSAYTEKERRAVRHILIAPKPASGAAETSDADWQAALDRADGVRAALLAGADFAQKAKAESDDQATKDAGGDLGTVARQQTWPGFEEAVWSLSLDQISEPVKTQYGYEIIQVTAITPATQTPLTQVQAGIAQTVQEQKQEAAWQAWLAEMKRELQVTIKAGMETTTTAF
jgi:parvulin-like peptidyl-prolyl isomerase